MFKVSALKAVLIFSFLNFSAPVFAATSFCFMISDLNKQAPLAQEGDCAEATTPASTFKVPLAVMGLDSQIFKNGHEPLWLYRKEIGESREVCQAGQTPQSWLTNSCVWFSQDLTRKLGMKAFKAYVENFNYGNLDVTGDPGKNNGLTHSWLVSSLKITPAGQIGFLKKLLEDKLPVSKQAQSRTRELLFLEELSGGWKLYGKTGTGNELNPDGSPNEKTHLGWFVGWVSKGGQTRVFAYRMADEKKPEIPGGKRAKEALKAKLASSGYLKD